MPGPSLVRGAHPWQVARRAREDKALYPIDPGPAILLAAAPFVGSFLGVLARRIPRGESVVLPRSHCETCGTVLRGRDLVPILSFLALRGRARCCGAAIAPSHLAIELLAVLVPGLLLAALPDASWATALAGSVLGWWLLALAAIDLACWRLPDGLTLPLMLAGFAQAALPPLLEAQVWPSALLLDRAAAAGLGWACLAGLAGLYRRVRGREGIGMGDAKLLAAGGAWCGLASLPWIVLIGAASGLVLGLLAHGRSTRGGTAIPFGPTLALGIWVTWLLARPEAGLIVP